VLPVLFFEPFLYREEELTGACLLLHSDKNPEWSVAIVAQ
jgi:hypothetical protein